jgi:hypothetical protein
MKKERRCFVLKKRRKKKAGEGRKGKFKVG